jgi:hypothetical protein
VRRRLRVEHAGKALELTTVNVSDSGCALEWSGALPAEGDGIVVRLEEGLFGSSVRGVVCWVRPGAERAVGVRLVSAGRGGRHWRALVAAAASAGAPAA